jgi:hypothetical protein
MNFETQRQNIKSFLATFKDELLTAFDENEKELTRNRPEHMAIVRDMGRQAQWLKEIDKVEQGKILCDIVPNSDRSSVHELGHALLCFLCEVPTDKIRFVKINSDGSGTFQPIEKLPAPIMILIGLAGSMAEKIVFGDWEEGSDRFDRIKVRRALREYMDYENEDASEIVISIFEALVQKLIEKNIKIIKMTADILKVRGQMDYYEIVNYFEFFAQTEGGK